MIHKELMTWLTLEYKILFNLLKLRSDGSRLSEPLDIIAAIEKSVPFFEAAATAAAAALALQWFDAPSSMIPCLFIVFRCTNCQLFEKKKCFWSLFRLTNQEKKSLLIYIKHTLIHTFNVIRVILLPFSIQWTPNL